ncbi:hypothetical protein EUTSA_v10022783mg [Eutrema salsugineum]|uniref:Transcription repressor n=1 Tax=Eutrema salsugineum TaxID=72664 RepID=V4NUY8_EUTSA|nr:transcription repressor OFP7 [Eutrema salsugineum]ESQ50596.1 hypothetical protein EUTSA_v10022783mg [Eutrema salsugineum]
MTKRFKLKISRILSFKSCRSKEPSDLPFNPVHSIHRHKPPPPANHSTVVTTVPHRRRSSFRLHVLTAFGCGSRRRRSSTPLDVSFKNSPSLSPPQTPTFQWESEGKWHVIAQVDEGEYETPRRKIYDGDDRRRSGKKKERNARRRGSVSSAEEYEEETEKESLLLPSSTNLSPDYSSSELPRVTRRRRHTPKRKNASSVVKEESESSSPPPSPARLSTFMQRFMPCAAAAAVVVEGVAVVKRSEDPYEDFKGSMMEMIVEKNMFQVAELEQLLRCFLTLNAKRHHRAIVRAFSEVWVALFSGGNNDGSQRSSVRLSDYDEC